MEYAVEDLVDYREPMKLIDGIVDHSDEATICLFRPMDDDIFVEGGVVSDSYLLEYMGQGAFIREKIIQQESSNRSYRQGLFLGARDVEFHESSVEVGEDYWVRAEDFHRDDDIVSSRCSITLADDTDEVFVTGRLTAMLTDEITSLEDISHE